LLILDGTSPHIIDTEGRRTAGILPIEEYEEMTEDLQMGRAAREGKGEPRRPFEEVGKELRAAGEIDVWLPAVPSATLSASTEWSRIG
jgi:hypothetical protein